MGTAEFIEMFYVVTSSIPLILSYLILLDTKRDIRSYGKALNGSLLYLRGTHKMDRNRVFVQAFLMLPGIASLFLPTAIYPGPNQYYLVRLFFIVAPFFIAQLILLWNGIITRELRHNLIKYASAKISKEQHERGILQDTREDTQNVREKEQNARDIFHFRKRKELRD